MVCPHCSVNSHFTTTQAYNFSRGASDFGERALLLRCDNCQLPVAGIAINALSDEVQEYWPITTAGIEFPDVPIHIVNVAKEAHSCLIVSAPRAAAAMSRAAVEAVAKDKGVSAKNLEKKIDALEAQGYISEAMKEAAHEIRFAGNEAAHADIAQEAISVEDAQEIVTLMDAILERVYQEPARVARVRQRRAERMAGGGPT
jgi:hypothetical protein